MKHTALILAFATLSHPLLAADNIQLQQEIKLLQQQTKMLQTQLDKLQKQLVGQDNKQRSRKSKKPVSAKSKSAQKKTVPSRPPASSRAHSYHTSVIAVHTPLESASATGFYPTALIADNNRIITYIAGTPVITTPYLGERPAFDGSDYIVNISSINRDIRLMQQRRKLYDAYEKIGYPIPNRPIISLSGKSEPVASLTRPYAGQSQGDFGLGSSEVDVAAALNEYVEAFIGIAFDDSPPSAGGPRINNSSFDLNLGFVNIGNLDETPIYFTAGQLYAPFGRYSSSMISSPITLGLARTKTRPFILGYKSQSEPGPYAAVYGFIPDTTLGRSAVGGVNAGYIISSGDISGDIGAGLIGSIDDSQGMQGTGSAPFTTFGGFGSITNGSEAVGKVPAVDFHANVSFDRYSLTAEWVGTSRAFNPEDLSVNGRGAKPQALQLEGAVTFIAFNKPSSLAAGYQWSKDTLALNLPKRRISGVFNISIWKDTVESLEYRHDVDFSTGTFANGAPAPGQVNLNTIGTGKSADTLIAQLGVYF
ncbi:MAG: LbtU family siderophore porin [Legionella sp.]|nr:LbtU family siderophore porin [Legionella sp.]